MLCNFQAQSSPVLSDSEADGFNSALTGAIKAVHLSAVR